MIAEPILTIAQEMLASPDPTLQTFGRRLVAQVERVADLERQHGSLHGAAEKTIVKLREAQELITWLENEVEKRPVLPVDGASS